MISGRLVVQQEAEALSHLAHHFPESFPQAVQHLRSITGKIVCSGVGKSGYVAQKVAATFASTGTPSFFLHPTEALHGELGSLSASDAVIVFSHSGETLELLQFVHHSQAAIRIVVTSNPKSSLAFCADVVLLLPDLPEACPLGLSPTTSSMMMMSLGDALALTLSSLKDFQRDQYHRLHPAGALGHRLLTVAQVMRRPAPLVPKTASPQEIIQAMIRGGIDCVGLVDEEGALVEEMTLAHLPFLLGESSTKPQTTPLTVLPETSLSEALALMKGQGISALFIKDGQGVICGAIGLEDGIKVRPRSPR